MADDQTSDTTPAVAEGPVRLEDLVLGVDRPFRDENLRALEQQPVQLTMRRGYAISRGRKEEPIRGPRKHTMSLAEAYPHRLKFHEHERIVLRWRFIQKERQHRQAERDMNPDNPRAGLSHETVGTRDTLQL